MKRLLHAGCGHSPKPANYAAYVETRLDCDAEVKPDIVSSIVAMPMIPSRSFDAVFCHHCLEHLWHHEVALAVAEFHRVLKDEGDLVLMVPDLQAIGGMLAADEAGAVLYGNPRFGAVTALDLIYGHRGSVAAGQTHMAHRTGFTASVLRTALQRAGFEAQHVAIERTNLELRVTAIKGVARASEEPKAEGLPECEVRACLGEKTPLRQQGEVAEVCSQAWEVEG